MKFAIDQLAAAYAGYIKWIGILLSSVALANWVIKTMALDLDGVIGAVFSLYQSTFYEIFTLPEYLLNFDIPDRTKDFILLYVALGGVSTRTWSSLLSNVSEAGDVIIGDYAEPRSILLLIESKSRFLRITFLAMAFVLWPIFTRPFFKRPIMIYKGEALILWLPKKEYEQISLDNKRGEIFLEHRIIDTRLVWLLQLLGIVFAALSAIGLMEYLAKG